MKKIVILGSTGSIGIQTLDVVDNLGNIEILALSTNINIDILEKQILKYKPKIAVVMDDEGYFILKKRLKGNAVHICHGMEGLIEAATLSEASIVVNALVGNIGLLPTISAIESGKNIALANKETLVTSGEIVMRKVKEKGVFLHPIDSEHSAIFQCLAGNEANKIEKIYITASGGPFRDKNLSELKSVTVADALAHPNWVMGKKITIDSATLMNKGLEVIEAKWLFDLDISQIEVLIHPQSIIHSMVQFEDCSILAQLGEADMRLPIQYALTYPLRFCGNFKKIDFLKRNNLTFSKPKTDLFPCLKLALKAIEIGATMPAILNGANEIAVSLFLQEKITFMQISQLIEMTMASYNVKYDFTIDDIISDDKWARNFALKSYKNLR